MWGRAVRITRLGGFDIKVDASWLLIATLIVWSLSSGYFPQKVPGASPLTLVAISIIAMLGLFASLILHELAHSVVARRHGLPISGITLFLFGGVAELESEPKDPATELRVAIVGPIASLTLAVLCRSAALIADLAQPASAASAILGYLALINLMLALFNIAPAFPLDGGRVFRAVLWQRSGDLLSATRTAVRVSAYFAWALIVLGFSAVFTGQLGAGLWPVLVGLFLLAISHASLQRMETEHALTGRTVGNLMTRAALTAHPDQTLADLVDHIFLDHAVSFAPVIEAGTLLGYVDIHMVKRIDREHWTTSTVDDVIESLSDDNSVSPQMSGQELLAKITTSGRRKFLVVQDGKLEGVVTLSDLAAFLDVTRQLSQTSQEAP